MSLAAACRSPNEVTYRVPRSRIVLSASDETGPPPPPKPVDLVAHYGQLSALVHRLYHGPSTASTPEPQCVWLSKQRIASLLGLPLAVICRMMAGEPREKVIVAAARRKVRTLAAEHISFLTSHDTLVAWMPYSLLARTRLFHRQYPDKRISLRRLRAVYRAHGILKRRIKPHMTLTPSQMARQKAGRLNAFPKMLHAIHNEEPIYFLDESCFTSN